MVLSESNAPARPGYSHGPSSVFADKLFIVFEMANNHMGSVEHGTEILRRIHEVSGPFQDRFSFGFKFQYRDLATFIHPSFRSRTDLKYVKRFLDTELSEPQCLRLLDEVKKLGFAAVCTPFDEVSVERVNRHGYDVVKVASCSFTDWPLLEAIVKLDRPVVLSTAGAQLEDIDKVVSFFEHRGKAFALMHCVAEYPTPDDHLELNQIDLLRQRYPKVPIGYSAHESPDNVDAVKMVVAKGAAILEKHVGWRTPGYGLNDYSAEPPQIAIWLESADAALKICGVRGARPAFSERELTSLRDLRRGVFARRRIAKGARLHLADVDLAIPTARGQLTANHLSKYADFVAAAEIAPSEPVLESGLSHTDHREQVYEILRHVKELVRESKIVVPRQLDFEISHHYGIDRFYEFGATIMNYINREYCKKIIVMLPGQKHPEQFHRRKEETFHILYGQVRIALNGADHEYGPGDIVTVERGMRHAFTADKGAVIEEISSTHLGDDSFYTDEAITKNPDRKTLLTYWVA